MNADASPRKTTTPPTTTTTSKGALLIIVFNISKVQPFRNKAVTSKSIYEHMGGKFVGVSEEKVGKIKGDWTESKTVAAFQFPNRGEAETWFRDDPRTKQQDYLDVADVVVCDVERDVPSSDSDYPFATLIDVSHKCDHAKFDEFYNKHAQCMKDFGGIEIVKCRDLSKLRGTWDPTFLIIHQWKSKAHFDKWYDSSENSKLDQLGEINMITFTYEPLTPRFKKTDTTKN